LFPWYGNPLLQQSRALLWLQPLSLKAAVEVEVEVGAPEADRPQLEAPPPAREHHPRGRPARVAYLLQAAGQAHPSQLPTIRPFPVKG